METLVLALDLIGTFVFALSGAMTGVRHRLDMALFAVAGALKSLTYQLNPLAAVLLGVLTGIGGGMLRDVLVAEVPTVLRAELYAVAALAGAVVVVASQLLQLPSAPLAIVGALLCFGLRLVAISRGWTLPVARDRSSDET